MLDTQTRYKISSDLYTMLYHQEAVCQTESSDSSESLLSGSPAFVPDSGTSGFVAGVGEGLLLALLAFASPSFSCSAASTCKSLCQGMFNL